MGVQCLPRELYASLLQSLECKLPASMSVCSVIRLIDSGQLEGFVVWTGNWPDFSAALVLADTSKVKYSNPTEDICQKVNFSAKCEEVANLLAACRWFSPGTPASSTIKIGVPKISADVFDEIFLEITGPVPNSNQYRILYELPGSQVTSPGLLPDGINEGVINKETAVTVNSSWKFSMPGSLEMTTSLLSSEKILSVCLYDKDNTPIAWTMEQIYGAIGMTFVVPKFRRRGFGKYVTMRLAEKMKARGNCIYACIELDNEVSHKMHQELGFRPAKQPYTEIFFKFYSLEQK